MEIGILISRLNEGDKEAWNMLIKRYSSKIYNIALNFSGNSDEAADITQDIFVKIYNNIEKFQQHYSFTSWLFRIAKNHCIDHWRKNKKYQETLEIEDKHHQKNESAEDILIKNLDLNKLRDTLKYLPDELRILIIMRDIQGYSYTEISEHLNIPLGTTKSRINRARIKLATLFIKGEK